MNDKINDIFKECPNCGHKWKTRNDFLADKNVILIGYQAHFNELETGLFQFNHSCGTTFSVMAKDFRDLYDGPIFEDTKTGTRHCPGYCLKKSELAPCPAKCECSYVREIIQKILKWERKEGEKLDLS